MQTSTKEVIAVTPELLQKMAEGVWVADKSGAIVFANRALARLLGREPSQLTDQHWRKLLAGAEAKQLPLSDLREVRLAHSNGQELEGELQVIPVELAGRPAQLFIFRDLSRLCRQSPTQADFLATVSHELRTPLAAIREAMALLAETAGPALSSRPRRYLEIAQEEIDRLTRMITNLIESSRMETGRVTLKPEPLDLRHTIERALNNLSLLIARKNLQVEKVFPSVLPPVQADQDRLLQVLLNLLDNAIKYSPPGSTIRVAARLLPAGSPGTDPLPGTPYVQVDISDAGPGIPAEFQDRIFRKFERLDPHGPGIGLGLHIVQSLVQLHHGRVWVSSRLGEGATFSFTIPAGEENG